jgi:CheY-like chemotaxis protein
MGLNGRLEDLPLLDIVQVVAFSQKTGFLSVETPRGEAGIVFERGLVVASFTPGGPPLDPRAAQLDDDQRARMIRGRIETTLEHLIRLREGGFHFSLTPEVPAQVSGRDISEETLSYGIKADELLLELTRGMDEDRREASAAVESGFAEAAEEAAAHTAPPAGAVAEAEADLPEETGIEAPDSAPLASEALPPIQPPSAASQGVVLLVDDEADLRTLLAETFIDGGWQVVEAGDPATAMRAARSLSDLGLPFVLVVDRSMPSSDGASFDGGLEVVRRLKKAGFSTPVLMMTDRMTGAVTDRARKLGVAKFVFKPTLSRLDSDQFAADIRAFGLHIRERSLPLLGAAASVPTLPSPALAAPVPRTEEAWRQAADLQRRLEDLRRPQDAAQISALVMNMARDFFERAALFIVKDEELRGLGGFGPAAGDDIILVLRDLMIPLAEPSVFQDAVASGRPHVGPLPEGPWERKLLATLGRFDAKDGALLPLVANRETIALLYADNPNSGSAIGVLETLEVFLSQAGVALENAFLQRKLEARRAGPGREPTLPATSPGGATAARLGSG